MLNAQVTIDSTPELNLETAGVYELVSVGGASRRWRRRTITGPYQHGQKTVGAVLDTGSLVIVVRCLGDSWVAVDSARASLFSAVSRFSYLVTVAVEGVVDQWVCEPADIALTSGDALNKFQVMASMQEYTLTIPVYPLPQRILEIA
jgi:hypothetical protein